MRDTGYPVTLVFYGYTHCPDVCPLVMSDIDRRRILQLPDDVRDETQMVFITTDPARDTPDVLRDYLDHYDADFVGLTGDLDDIVTAADAMGVAIEGTKKLPERWVRRRPRRPGDRLPRDQAPVIWTEGTPVDDMVTDIEKLAGS